MDSKLKCVFELPSDASPQVKILSWNVDADLTVHNVDIHDKFSTIIVKAIWL